MVLRSVEYCSRMVYCISLGTLREKTVLQIVRGSQGLTIRSIRRVLFTDGILHLIRDTWKKKTALQIVRGSEGLTIRSIRADR